MKSLLLPATLLLLNCTACSYAKPRPEAADALPDIVFEKDVSAEQHLRVARRRVAPIIDRKKEAERREWLKKHPEITEGPSLSSRMYRYSFVVSPSSAKLRGKKGLDREIWAFRLAEYDSGEGSPTFLDATLSNGVLVYTYKSMGHACANVVRITPGKAPRELGLAGSALYTKQFGHSERSDFGPWAHIEGSIKEHNLAVEVSDGRGMTRFVFNTENGEDKWEWKRESGPEPDPELKVGDFTGY